MLFTKIDTTSEMKYFSTLQRQEENLEENMNVPSQEENMNEFENDDIPMGCQGSCWSSCIGQCRRSQY